jgi:hypothetical protein
MSDPPKTKNGCEELVIVTTVDMTRICTCLMPPTPDKPYWRYETTIWDLKCGKYSSKEDNFSQGLAIVEHERAVLVISSDPETLMGECT